MSEKLYRFLFMLYPEHFRRRYGDEALRLVHERASHEEGFISGLRLWMDLLLDLATSLPREYSNAPRATVGVTQSASGEPSFLLLDERSLKPSLLFLGGAISALLFWACNYAVVHSRTFPEQFRDQHSLQWLVQNDLALALSSSEEEAGNIWISVRHLVAGDSSSSLPNPQFILIPPGLKLEVFDWGGSGEAIVLIAGAGNSADVFDKFARSLVPRYHLYGFASRPLGPSSHLGDDVVAVIDALQLNRPVVAAYALSGEELSSVSGRVPRNISGLIDLSALAAGQSQARILRAGSDEREVLGVMNQFLTELR